MSRDDPAATPGREPGGDEAPRVVVTRGGRPSPEQLAALVVALTPAGVPASPRQAPAWRRAALAEGLGRPVALDAPDLAFQARQT